MRANLVDVISLGCSKNLVDSEYLMRQLATLGYTLRHDPEEVSGEIVVVNTCGFIQAAQEESIQVILSLLEAKARGEVGAVYVMGCLSERFREELASELPEIDKIYGKYDWKALIAELGAAAMSKEGRSGQVLYRPISIPQVTPSHYSYVKISEGCDRSCSYCAIPLITGRYKSRPMEEILHEISERVSQGCSEFQIIAQDSTFYGLDLYRTPSIASLMQRIAEIEGVHWVRLHYAYPNHFPLDLLDVMHEYSNICAYLDLALQHSSDRMLRLMRRGITRAETLELLRTIRERVPGIALRTTMLVGHPGETEEDFEDLYRFVEEVRFDRLGAFLYSHEVGTFAYQHYEDDVPPEIKEERYDRLMSLQEGIAHEISTRKIGQQCEVVIDSKAGEYFIGRTMQDSPEVDPEVLITSEEPLSIGAYYQARIIGVEDYDLQAVVESPI